MFKFDVLEIDDFVIKKKEIKIFYNSDDKKSLTDWLNIGTNNNGKIEAPNLSSPLNIKNKSNRKTTQSSIGWFSCGTNTVERNTIDVGIMTSPYSHKGTSGFNIENSNIFKCLMSFSCRKTINPTWKNKKDYYFEPNESHEQFNQFKYLLTN